MDALTNDINTIYLSGETSANVFPKKYEIDGISITIMFNRMSAELRTANIKLGSRDSELENKIREVLEKAIPSGNISIR